MDITPSDPLSNVAYALREHASPTPVKDRKCGSSKKKTPNRFMTSSAKKRYNYKHHLVNSDEIDDEDNRDNHDTFVSPIVNPSRVRSVLFSDDSKKLSKEELLNDNGGNEIKDSECNTHTDGDGYETPPSYTVYSASQTQTLSARKTPTLSLFSPTLSQPDTTERKMIKRFDDEYKQTLIDEAIGTQARQESVRNITLFTIGLFALYLTLGCLYYSVWEESQWPLEESLIFLIYTVTTVGYGNHDIPSSPRCRVFTMLFILLGIGLVTVFFSEIFQFLVIKAARAQYMHDEERITLRGLKAMQSGSGGQDNREEDDDVEMDIEGQQKSHLKSFRYSVQKSGKQTSQRVRSLFCNLYSTIKLQLKNTKLGQYIIVLFPFVSLLLVGSLVVGCIEGWCAIDSLYWAVVTLTTVGYGDMTPSKPESIWFSIFYLPTATIFLSLFLSHIATAYIKLHISQVVRIENKLRKKYEKNDQVHKDKMSSPMIEYNPSGETENSSPETSLREESSRNDDLPKLGKAMSMKDLMNTAKKAERKRAVPQDVSSTPSLSLRSKVQERLAFIISYEVCNNEPMIEIKDSEVILSNNWNHIFELWMIPKKAKETFKTVYCSIILSVGKMNLSEGGMEVLLNMNPEKFQKIFNPLTIAMGSPECLEAWLVSTEHLIKQ